MGSYVREAEVDFRNLMQDTAYTSLPAGKAAAGAQPPLSDRTYFIFFYRPDSSGQYALQYWNTQQVLPDAGILESSLKAGFAQLANGFYVWNKLDTAGTIAICLVPVKWNYIVTNDYLKNSFVNNARIGDQYDIFPGEGLSGTITSVHGVPLFYLVQKKSGQYAGDNMVSVWLLILAVLSVLLFVHLCAAYFAAHKSFLYGFLFLLGTIIFLRSITYIFPIPLSLRHFELFDPTIYGSGFVLRSLGDLLINALLFVWIVVFTRHQLAASNTTLRGNHQYLKWWVLAGGCLLMLSATFIGIHIVRSLISDSQISFDVINFFSLNIYSIIGFIILCCMAVGYYFLCQLVLYLIKPFFTAAFPELYLATTILGLTLLTFNIGSRQQGLQLYGLAWLLLTLFLLNSRYVNQIATRIISSKLVFWIFFFPFL